MDEDQIARELKQSNIHLKAISLWLMIIAFLSVIYFVWVAILFIIDDCSYGFC